MIFVPSFCWCRPDDVDAVTLETCQSTVALALGMVMAGTGGKHKKDMAWSRFESKFINGLIQVEILFFIVSCSENTKLQGDLAALRTLRSLRKKTSLDTGILW